MSDFINFNGNIVPNDTPVFKAASRAARFGDGLFETMRMHNGQLVLSDFHGERLFSGLELLQFKLPMHFTWSFLLHEIEKLMNHHHYRECARVRLMVCRGEGALNEEAENSPQFLVECFPADKYSFNEVGLKIDVFENSRKNADAYSHLKTSNFLPYVMAALYAHEQGLDECVLLNHEGRICDGTISNIFWVRDDAVFTPPLSEGGIGGTMRRYLLQSLPEVGLEVKEINATPNELLAADEIFLSNAVRGIRWVKTFRKKEYQNKTARFICDRVVCSLTK